MTAGARFGPSDVYAPQPRALWRTAASIPPVPRKLAPLVKGMVKRANRLLEPLEGMGDTAQSRSPILIIGPPRSGTTLLYQLLVQQFEVAYLSNAHHAFFGAPAVLERLVPRRLRRPPDDQGSRFGVTHGWWAPSEAANFWYRFFPLKPHAVEPADLEAERGRTLRRAIAALSRAAQAPMISKNVVCSVRVEAIAAFVPEMRFVVMYRDHLEVATSILAARKNAQGTYTNWWSVEPANIDELKQLPPERQVVEQVRAVEQAIDRARKVLSGERFIDVDYAELIADPRSVLDHLAGRLGLTPRPGAPPLPQTFPRRDRNQLDPQLAVRLAEYLGR